MLKVAFFRGEDENGLHAIPLFGPADRVFEKTAAPRLLPEVSRYISSLQPRQDAQYVLLNAMGAGEYWGCFPAGTLVRTEEGERPIEGVRVGASVLTHRNRWRRVEAVKTKQCDSPLVDLFIQGLPRLEPALTATPNHELWVVPAEELHRARWDHLYGLDARIPVATRRQAMVRSLAFDWRSLGTLRHGDLVAQPFPLEEDENALGDLQWNDADIAFLLGLYAAEGCVALRYRTDKPVYDKLRNGKFERPIKSVVFVIGGHEARKAERVRRVVAARGYAAQVTPEDATHSIRLEVCWQELAELCKDHIGDRANKKSLSHALLRMPRSWQAEFFAAYSGGDGCITPSGSRGAGSVRCVSASAKLLVDMRLLLARQGLVASISGWHNKKATWYAGRPIYELLLGGSQLHGRRAVAKGYIHPDGFLLSAVKCTKEYAWSGAVYDLQVEEDCSYTASGIAVHNSNINGDRFPEASLIHKPDDWTGNPLLDKLKAKDWAYGFPTFYFAHPYAHHRNKDATRAFGEVELAAWNDHMKRVELIARVDKDKCLSFGGTGVWDKLKAGGYPDVSMGCFTAGTRVTLADGSRKPIEQIAVGDLVLTHRGRARAVTSLHRRAYKGDLYSIKAEATPAIRCTHQHPFLVVPEAQVKTKNDRAEMLWNADLSLRPEWAHAECLTLSHFALAPVPGCASSGAPTRALARLVGYYLAEGHVLHSKEGKPCGIELTTHQDDAIHQEIEQLCQEFGTQNPPAFAARKNSDCAVSVYIHDARLAECCQELAGRYSLTKQLSSDVLSWPAPLQLELLGAYANGDGCGTEHGELKWSTASEALAWQVQLILSRSGALASVTKLHHKASALVNKETDEWVIHLGKQAAQRLRQYTAKVRPVEVFKAKNSRMLGNDVETGARFVITPLRTIDAIYAEVDVYNFEVEEDESYVVEGLAVHNCKVPYDICSICLDWDTYRKAQATFNKEKDRSPGDAVLRFHKELIKKRGKGIRGVSITRADYCEHAGKQMNRILPDGRKVYVDNDYPNFFDISFVFIGADKTAKTMMKIADAGRAFWSVSGAELAEKLGYADGDEVLLPALAAEGTCEKVASVSEDALKYAFLGKLAKNKDAEIVKDVMPSQFAGKAVPLLTRSESDLPPKVLDALGASPLAEALSTTAGLGMVLRPREFQRVVLIQMGNRPLADKLDEENTVFPKVDEELPVPMGPSSFSLLLARLLLPLMSARSGLGPFVEGRVVAPCPPQSPSKEKRGSASSHPNVLLCKMGAAYNSYRAGLMELVAHTQDLVTSMASPSEEQLHKLAAAPVDSVFTPLSASYLKLAFWDEVESANNAAVERGLPSRNTGAQNNKTAGGH